MASTTDDEKYVALALKGVAGLKAMIVPEDPKKSNDGFPWTEVSHNKAMRLTIYKSDIPKLPTRHKAVIQLPFTRDEFQTVLLDNSRRTAWDSGTIAVDERPVSGAGELFSLQYACTASNFGVSSRDYINAVGFEEIPGGGGIYGGTGIEEHPAFPPRSGALRAINYPGGFYIVPIPAPADAPEALRSRPWISFSFVIHIDLRGWLPQFVINTAMSSNFAEFFKGLIGELERRRAAK